MNRHTVSCYLIGQGTLLIQCAQLWHQQNHSVLGVISADTAVTAWAAQHQIDTCTPTDNWVQFLQRVPFDYLFSIVNPHILPAAVLALPRQMAINYHDAPLPRYAGMYATTWAILQGETRHGVTWHQMTPGIDAGDILQQETFALAAEETAFTLNARCYDAAIRSFARLLPALASQSVIPRPQNLAQRSYFSLTKRPLAAAIIDWQKEAAQIEALVRGLTFGPYPNPLTSPKLLINDTFWAVTDVHVLHTASAAAPGTILAIRPDGLQVSTGSHDLRVSQVTTLTGQPVSILDLPLTVGTPLASLQPAAAHHIQQQHEHISRAEPFWVKRLASLQPAQLPYEQRRSSHPPRWRQQAIDLPTAVVEFVAGQGWSMADFLAAVWAAYLVRLTGVTTFDLGWQMGPDAPFDGRLLAQYVPFRLRLEAAWPLASFYQAVQKQRRVLTKRLTFAQDVWRRYPHLHYQALPLGLAQGVDVAAYVPPDEAALLLVTHDRMGVWLYDQQVWSETAVSRISRQITTLCEAWLEDAERPLWQLSVLTPAERAHLLAQGQGVSYPPPPGQTWLTLWAAQVGQTPDATALICGDQQWTYWQLQQQAARLAQDLYQCGVRPQTVVGVCLERSVAAVVALLGIWQAGGVYVPLDPAYPSERLQFMVVDAQVTVLLTQPHLGEVWAQTAVSVIYLDGSGEEMAPTQTPAASYEAQPEDTAYIIYTSGSTGQPKGVRVGHGGLLAHCLSVQTVYEIGPADRVLQFASFNFDAALEQLLVPLTQGATVVMRGEEMWGAADMAHKLVEAQITVANFPTAYWRLLCQEWVSLTTWPQALRLLVIGGEAMTVQTWRQWQQTPLRAMPLLNAYGPTEATITATLFEVADTPDAYSEAAIIPIGRPLPNRAVYILDGYGQPTPMGGPGELYVAGVGVAQGYQNQPRLTAQRFVPNPFAQTLAQARLYRTGDVARYLADGTIIFQGRRDNQVKVRGFRIELGEIEAALRRCVGVRETAVGVHEDEVGDKRITAYIVPAVPQTPPTGAQLRQALAAQLPAYMLPAAFVFLDGLPLLPTGKVDRRALPLPAATRPDLGAAYVPPRSPVEKMLAEFWTAVLGVTPIGVADNFFQLGGDSLLATRLVAWLSQAFRLPLPLTTLFESPTIATLAQELERRELTPGQVAAIARLRHHINQLSPDEIHRQIHHKKSNL